MNTLVSIGMVAAWGYSAVGVLIPGVFPRAEHGMAPHLYFEAAAGVVTFVLLGKMLESRARKRLSDAVRGLISLPETAYRVLEDHSGEVVAVRREPPRSYQHRLGTIRPKPVLVFIYNLFGIPIAAGACTRSLVGSFRPCWRARASVLLNSLRLKSFEQRSAN